MQSTASAATVELEKALRQNKKQKKLIEKAIAHVNTVNDIFGSGGVTDDEAVYIVLHFNALYTRVRPQTCWLLSHPLVRTRRFPAMSPLLRRLEARFLVLLLLLLLLPRQPHPMSVVHIRSWRPGDCWHSCTWVLVPCLVRSCPETPTCLLRQPTPLVCWRSSLHSTSTVSVLQLARCWTSRMKVAAVQVNIG